MKLFLVIRLGLKIVWNIGFVKMNEILLEDFGEFWEQSFDVGFFWLDLEVDFMEFLMWIGDGEYGLLFDVV